MSDDEKDDFPENVDYDTDNDSIGEKYEDKAILDLLLDTEIILKNLQRNMEGREHVNGVWKQTRLPIARDEVIAQIINSLRSIINPSNSFSYLEESQAKMSIYEKIIEFEYLAVEEPTIDNKDYETLINMCDHSLELFYGKVIDGHLTTALKDIFAGTNTQKEEKTSTGLFSMNNLLGNNKS